MICLFNNGEDLSNEPMFDFRMVNTRNRSGWWCELVKNKVKNAVEPVVMLKLKM